MGGLDLDAKVEEEEEEVQQHAFSCFCRSLNKCAGGMMIRHPPTNYYYH
jgi:hypothetical protein